MPACAERRKGNGVGSCALSVTYFDGLRPLRSVPLRFASASCCLASNPPRSGYKAAAQWSQVIVNIVVTRKPAPSRFAGKKIIPAKHPNSSIRDL